MLISSSETGQRYQLLSRFRILQDEHCDPLARRFPDDCRYDIGVDVG